MSKFQKLVLKALMLLLYTNKDKIKGSWLEYEFDKTISEILDKVEG